MKKRPQLLTALLVFHPMPPTRSKAASMGGGKGKGGGHREVGEARKAGGGSGGAKAGQCLIFGLN